MTTTLVTGIAELVTFDDALEGAGQAEGLGLLHDAAVVVGDGRVLWTGPASRAPDADERRDLEGRAVIPGFVDSHAHLVFAGDRSAEFAARMSGTPYDGGGIATSVRATRAATDDQLRSLLAARVREMRAQGTTTVEVKSGYGLTVADEARALRIAREQTDETTFLGAHVVPEEYADRRAEYVDLVTGPMLRACAPHARWVDVFCEPHSAHAFTEEEARRVLAAGREAGLGLRVHGNQLGPGPGVRLAVEHEAAQRGPLHLPQRGRRRGAGRGGRHHGGDAAARGGVLDPVALPGRPAPGGRRGLGRARDRLQPGHLLLVVDAVRGRPRRPRDAPDPG